MNEKLIFEIDVDNNTERDFNRIRQQLLELERLTNSTTGNQASRERIANVNREREAERNRSQEKQANIRQETVLDTNASKLSIEQSRARTQEDNRRSRERIDNIRSRNREVQLAGQAESRQIQRLRIQEQRRAREQRASLARLSTQQRSINRNFLSWGTSLNAVGTILGGSVLFGIQNLGRRVLEVTVNIERLRLGLAALAGNQQIADRQISRARELARLPGIQFEGGVRSITQLRAAGFDQNTSARLLQEISNLTAIAGRSAEDTSRALYQFTQIGGLRQFRTEELRQLYEIAPQLRRVFQDLYGSFSGEGIQAAIERGGRTFAQELERILGRLEQGPRAPAGTLANSLENLRDSFGDLGRAIGDDLEPAIKALVNFIDDVVSETAEAVEGNRFLIPTVASSTLLGTGLGAYGGYRFGRRGLANQAVVPSQFSDIIDDVLRDSPRFGRERHSSRVSQLLARDIDSATRTFVSNTGREVPTQVRLTDRQARFLSRQYAQTRGADLARFVSRGTAPGAIAGAGVGAGIGFIIAPGVEAVADRIHGVERPGGTGPGPLTRAVAASAQEIGTDILTFRQSFRDIDAAARSFADAINNFTVSTNETQARFRTSFALLERNNLEFYTATNTYFDRLSDFRTASERDITSFESRIAANQARITEIRDNPAGRRVRTPGGVFGEPGLTNAQRVEIRRLEEDIANLNIGIESLRSGLQSRVRAAQQLVADQERRTRDLLPDFRIDPTEALRIGETGTVDITSRRGIIRSTRSAIPEGPIGTDVRTTLDNLVEVSRNLLASQGSPEIGGPIRGFLGTPTGTDVLRSGLLDPNRLTDLRSETRGLLNEWVQIQDTVTNFFRQADRQTEAGGFIPTVRIQATETRDELQLLLDLSLIHI